MTNNSVLEDYGLHQYALHGDDEGVRRALRAGADVNTLDSDGRNAIMCVVSGEHWRDLDACDVSFKSPARLNALKLLLNHPSTSMVSMNLPHPYMNGVIPLGMASWLDYHEAVRVLLEETVDSVSVDGMDSHGATALMYAARDGNLEVVKILLSHGARADFRDRHYRTSIHFGLKHPQVLWLCETTLRRHRLRESKSAERTRLYPLDSKDDLLALLTCSSPFCEELSPPPLAIFTKQDISRLTNTLIQCVLTSDVSFMYSLLFSPPLPPSSASALYPMSVPPLVNVSDSNGWSAIHHCASVDNPSIQILDALYCAGAEISLFTVKEEYTILHVLARSALADSFTSDSSQSLLDFSIHLIEHLRAPMAAQDKTDETCIHQAAEHGQSLELLKLFLACDSNGTIREMKNSRGLTALQIAKPEFLSAFGVEGERSPSALSQHTIRPSHLVTSFSVSGPSSPVVANQGLSSDMASLFFSAGLNVAQASRQLLENLQLTSPSNTHSHRNEDIRLVEQRVNEAQDLSDLLVVRFQGQIDDVSRNIDDLRENINEVDSFSSTLLIAARRKLALRGLVPLLSKRLQQDSEDSEKTCIHTEGTDSPASLSSQMCSFCSEQGPNYVSRASQTVPAVNAPEAAWIQHFGRVSSLLGVSRVKNWLKRIVGPAKGLHMLKPSIVIDIDEENCAVGHEVKCRVPSPSLSLEPRDILDFSIDSALCTSQVVLENVEHELRILKGCLAAAEEFLQKAQSSISKVQRMVLRGAKQRDLMVLHLYSTAITSINESHEAHVPSSSSSSSVTQPNALSSCPSITSISTIYSTTSSIASAEPTVPGDDDSIKMIRRLLSRKIEAQLSGAWDEVDKIVASLQIVKEAVRSVKRRAYL